ncbi:MAG: metallophosphoesterase [Planctomycetes bacterium]|nr:metallophosphoesterase [Planctomycetota bacterium]
MRARLLFVGDIHLGRAPARIPPALEDYGITARSCGPAAAWEHTVRHAVREVPDAVVLAGDVVESDNARFEAYRHLARGVEQLVAAGIAVCGVTGNHDVEALPRLARAVDAFRLLGAHGTWSTHTITRDGHPLLRIAGWSFPRRVHPDRLPLDTFPAAGDVPVIGVAHCDLDAAESPYAPVSRHALARTGAAGWFLGHVHSPDLVPGPQPIGYLGSLVGLDPTEAGRRGPWWVEVGEDGRITRLEHLPLAPLRWEAIDVAVDADLDPDDLLDFLGKAVRERATALGAEELAEVRVLGVRIRLAGRVRAHRRLATQLAELTREPLVIPLGERAAFLDRVVDDTAPAVELGALAEGGDPLALLVRDLLALEARDERGVELIRAAAGRFQAVANRPQFAPCGTGWHPDDEAIRTLLLRAGRRALESLLAQRAAPKGSQA